MFCEAVDPSQQHHTGLRGRRRSPGNTMSKDIEKPPIPELSDDNIYRAGISMKQERLIGRLTVAWAALELVMQDAIWTLLGVGVDDGRILTAGADANRKMQWLGAFANKHFSGDE